MDPGKDGILRQLNENPEIRADDTVLIDMRRVTIYAIARSRTRTRKTTATRPTVRLGANAQAGAAGAALGSSERTERRRSISR